MERLHNVIIEVVKEVAKARDERKAAENYSAGSAKNKAAVVVNVNGARLEAIRPRRRSHSRRDPRRAEHLHVSKGYEVAPTSQLRAW